jgi:hypothetical protein
MSCKLVYDDHTTYLQVQRGDRFGMLVAVEPEPDPASDAPGDTSWIFRCDCGREVSLYVGLIAAAMSVDGWCSCPNCPVVIKKKVGDA